MVLQVSTVIQQHSARKSHFGASFGEQRMCLTRGHYVRKPYRKHGLTHIGDTIFLRLQICVSDVKPASPMRRVIGDVFLQPASLMTPHIGDVDC